MSGCECGCNPMVRAFTDGEDGAPSVLFHECRNPTFEGPNAREVVQRVWPRIARVRNPFVCDHTVVTYRFDPSVTASSDVRVRVPVPRETETALSIAAIRSPPSRSRHTFTRT